MIIKKSFPFSRRQWIFMNGTVNTVHKDFDD